MGQNQLGDVLAMGRPHDINLDIVVFVYRLYGGVGWHAGQAPRRPHCRACGYGWLDQSTHHQIFRGLVEYLAPDIIRIHAGRAGASAQQFTAAYVDDLWLFIFLWLAGIEPGA